MLHVQAHVLAMLQKMLELLEQHKPSEFHLTTRQELLTKLPSLLSQIMMEKQLVQQVQLGQYRSRLLLEILSAMLM
ncbi:MAG: hypothetical protein EBS47_12720 [Betaproteobacteria bacterium]|nr:hypothetical protein [Betaproteobacteria bacterium]